jgi:hypothetical protein
MSDKKSCPVCGTDLEFATDTYCGGTCADIGEMRAHDDARIAELERENKVISGRLERELDRAIPILEERNATQARVAELERERDELRTLLKDGFAYVRDANRLMAADGDLDEEDEDGANEWLEKAAAALTVATLQADVLKAGEVASARKEASEAVAKHARLTAARDVVVEQARKFIERTADISEQHPAYGFVVMGIPLAKALAALDDALAHAPLEDACPGIGECHGALKWCDTCGDVKTCDDPTCDAHRASSRA